MPIPKFWIDWKRKRDRENLEQALYEKIDKDRELEERQHSLPKEKPLKQEHPAMDVALMWTQPGGWLAKVMAPGAYKALIETAISGNTEDLLYSATPVGKTKFTTKALENEMKAAANKGVRDANAFVKDPAVQASIQRNTDWFARQQALGQTQIQWPATQASEYITRANTSPKIELVDLGVVSNGRGAYARVLQDGTEKFIFTPQTIRAGYSNKIDINKNLPIEKVESTAFHERLHTLGYGDLGSNPVNVDIANKIWKSYSEVPAQLHEELKYLKNPTETAAWLSQSGKELGLKPGSKYIGKDGLEKLITKNERLSKLKKYFNLQTEDDYKRLWSGLTGTLFGTTVIVNNYGGAGGE